jgi:aryl-alcohol dehydrogenase-like predicted oxidoreductase
MLEGIEGGLRRLGTDHVDLYVIHGPGPNVPLEETMEVMDELLEREKARYIGMSHFH